MQKSSKVGIEIVPFTAMRRYLPAARPWRSGCGTEGSCRCQDSDCPDSCRHKSGPAWFDTRARTAAGPGGRIDARAARRSRFAGHLKRLGAAHCPPADIGRRRPPSWIGVDIIRWRTRGQVPPSAFAIQKPLHRHSAIKQAKSMFKFARFAYTKSISFLYDSCRMRGHQIWDQQRCQRGQRSTSGSAPTDRR
jgi:hypothetical protein